MCWKIYACLLLTSTMLKSAVSFDQQKDNGGQLDFVKPYNYPQEEVIDEYLRKYRMPSKPDNEDEEIQKLMYEEDDEMNCSTEIRMLKPYKLTYENRSYPVIQSRYFTQKIRNVSCKNHGNSCFDEISLKAYFKASCETEQGSIQLYVLDGEKVVAMTVSYNCCCKCTIRDTMK